MNLQNDRIRQAKLLEQRRKAIGSFVKLMYIGKPKETIHIRFDDLMKWLMSHNKIRFSASLYENLLQKELKDKILGRPMTKEVFDSLCDYIWDLAVYCTSEKNKNERETSEVLAERARRAREKRARR